MTATFTLPSVRRFEGVAMPALDAAALSTGDVPVLVRGVRDRMHLSEVMVLIRRRRGVAEVALLRFEGTQDALLSVRVDRPIALAGELRRHLGRKVASCATVSGRIEVVLVGAATARRSGTPWRSTAVADHGVVGPAASVHAIHDPRPVADRRGDRPWSPAARGTAHTTVAPVAAAPYGAAPRTTVAPHAPYAAAPLVPARPQRPAAPAPRPVVTDEARESALIAEVLAGRADSYEVVKQVPGPDGRPVAVAVRMTAIRNARGAFEGFVARAV